jgi:biopolymer transport protein ExbD
MLFFMVMAGAVRVERELNTKLPGTAETSGPSDFVDEIIIEISEDGSVRLNDEPMDNASSREMPQLSGTLMRLKQASDAAKSPILVTVLSEPEAKYARTVDVLDALALAQIENVTFTVEEEQ